jgi:predicted RNA-binding protein YlqC (UPF0109 family)
MVDLKQVLLDLARALVDDQEAVEVTETVVEDTVTLSLRVAEGDMGKVIGRHGRIANALRTVLKAAGNLNHQKVIVDIDS